MELTIYKKVELHEPKFIIGLDGWANAGKISTNVVIYLINKLKAEKFAEIKSDLFYILSLNRPQVSITEGLVREFSFPKNYLYFAKDKKTLKDFIFLLGHEPDIRWAEYADNVFHIAKLYNVKRIITVGGFADYILHTAEPPVSAAVNTKNMKAHMQEFSVEFIDYHGSASLHSFFHLRKDIEIVTLWGSVPVYLTQSPKSYYSVLKVLLAVSEMNIDIEDMKEAAEKVDEKIEEIIAQNPHLKELVENLKELQNERKPSRQEIENLIKEIEEFFKKQKGEGYEGNNPLL